MTGASPDRVVGAAFAPIWAGEAGATAPPSFLSLVWLDESLALHPEVQRVVARPGVASESMQHLVPDDLPGIGVQEGRGDRNAVMMEILAADYPPVLGPAEQVVAG